MYYIFNKNMLAVIKVFVLQLSDTQSKIQVIQFPIYILKYLTIYLKKSDYFYRLSQSLADYKTGW